MSGEGISLKVYSATNPLGEPINILPGRVEPRMLDQLTGIGGGSFKIATNDSKLISNPNLINSQNIVRFFADNVCTGAMIIRKHKAVTIDSGEAASEGYEVSGPGLKAWFNNATVRPYGGLKQGSKDTRYFNWGSEQGDWYESSEWITPYILGTVLQTPEGWKKFPEKWPKDTPAKWVWGTTYNLPTMPLGLNYFRYEFTAASARAYVLYVAADDQVSVFVNGEKLAVTDIDKTALHETKRLEFSLPAGDHVIAFSAQNQPLKDGTPRGPAGMVAAIFYLSGDKEVRLTMTGDSGWKVNPYPTVEPGWTIGEILLTLLAEAEARGVLFPTFITPTFTTTHDSNGVEWEKAAWAFKVGESLMSVLSKVEELYGKAWINPVTLEFNLAQDRGVDRSVFVYDVDEVTVLSSPIEFSKGRNLAKAITERESELVNNLAVKTAEGWIIADSDDPDTVNDYGVIEGVIDTGSSIGISTQLAQVIFAQHSQPDQGATYEVIPDREIPFTHFGVGDWVLAPNEYGVSVKRRVVSISLTENDSGGINYTIEFDTIFKDTEQKIAKAVSKLGGGGIGASYSNATIQGNPFGSPEVIGGGINPPTLIPKAPENLIVTSEGAWDSKGVSPISRVTITCDPVIQNTDDSDTVPQLYEFWGYLTSDGEDYISPLGVSAINEIVLPQNFETGVNWTFKVRASNPGGPFSAFSDAESHTTVGPTDPLPAPSTPILSSVSGLLVVGWDGLLDGAPPAPEFRYVYGEVAEVIASVTGTFSVKGTALFEEGQMTIPGLTIGSEYAVRLIAANGLGIPSSASSIANIILTGIDLGDLDVSVGEAIEAAHQAAIEAKQSTNLLEDPSFERNDEEYWDLAASGVTNVTTDPRSGTRHLRIEAKSAEYDAFKYLVPIPCDPGETYSFRVYFNADTIVNAGLAEDALELDIDSGATSSLGTISELGTSGEPSGGNYIVMSGEWLVPADTYFFVPILRVLDTSNSNIYYVDDFRVFKMIDSTLVVDGSILADKIAAEAVVAGKIAANAIAAENIQAGQVTAEKLAADSVTANAIAANAINASHISAGSIEAIHIAAGVGGELDLSANESITLIVGELDGVNGELGDTQANLTEMQTYYTFGASGAVITKPGSPYELQLTNDRISMYENGNEVSYWDSGQLFVNSFVGEEVELGNHKLEKYGENGTIVRAL